MARNKQIARYPHFIGGKMKYKRIIWWKKNNDDWEILLAKEECDNKGINLIIVDNLNQLKLIYHISP